MSRMKRRALLDVDGMLLDFATPAKEVVRSITGEEPLHDILDDYDMFRQFDKDTQNKIYAAMKVPNWCLDIEPYPGAVDFIAKISQKVNVYFVTSPLGGPNWAHERELAIFKHFGFPRKYVVSTMSKEICVGDCFVDDKPAHVQKWAEHHKHGCAIVWDQPYNKNFVWPYRAKTWAELEELVLAE